MVKMTGLVLSVSTDNYYQGHEISINGVHVAHRPYDGSDADEVITEVAETFGALLRKATGWQEQREEDEDW